MSASEFDIMPAEIPTPAKADETTDLREALELGPVPPKSLAELRRTVRDCIGETIPLRRRWVSAIMERVVGPLAQRVAAHAAEIRALRAERDQARRMHRWNFDRIDGDVLVCRGDHDKGESCGDHDERFVPERRLTEASDRADRLAAAVRLLLPFVDRAAGEGLEWMEDCDSPSMDPVVLCTAATEVLGMELGDDAYSAILKQGEDEIRAARAALPEAITPKETSDV